MLKTKPFYFLAETLTCFTQQTNRKTKITLCFFTLYPLSCHLLTKPAVTPAADRLLWLLLPLHMKKPLQVGPHGSSHSTCFKMFTTKFDRYYHVLCPSGASAPCYNDVEMLTEFTWDDSNIRRVFIRKVTQGIHAKYIMFLLCVWAVLDFSCPYSPVMWSVYLFTSLLVFLGVHHLDDPAFGHSCYCGSFYILVSLRIIISFLPSRFNQFTEMYAQCMSASFSDPVRDYIQTNPGWYWAS